MEKRGANLEVGGGDEGSVGVELLVLEKKKKTGESVRSKRSDWVK